MASQVSSFWVTATSNIQTKIGGQLLTLKKRNIFRTDVWKQYVLGTKM